MVCNTNQPGNATNVGRQCCRVKLKTVPTIVITHTFCASRELGFPIGDAY